MRRWQVFLACVLIAITVLAFCDTSVAVLSAGQTAPNFTRYRHDTTQSVNLYDYAGQIVVLDFFAHWCGPCATASSQLEPYVQQYYNNLGGNPAGIPVKLISLCVSDQTVAETDQYIATYGLDLVLDDFNYTVYNNYGSGSIPQFAIINGVQNANFAQWDILYMQTGYGSGNYTTFRNYINQVVPANAPPVAVNDTYGLNEDATLSVAAAGVLANDTDADSNPLTAIKVTNTAHGTLALYSTGALSYTPTANYNGTDTFTYKANDGTSNSNVATVTLNIASINDAPVALADSYTVAKDGFLIGYSYQGVLANDTDVEGSALTASLVSSTSHGVLALYSSGALTYTPTTGFSGVDSFVYRAYDGAAYSDLATVLINVLGPIPGDATGDGRVDQADAIILAANWGKPTSGGTGAGDFNADGVVSAADASILAGNWGRGTSESAAAPEPGSLILLCGMGLAGLSSRRRRTVGR
jgi:VCBS repeat-containing protein